MSEEAPHALALWLLELKTGGSAVEFRLLYAWLLPTSPPPANRWGSRYNQKWISLGEGTVRYRLVRINLSAPLAPIRGMLDRLQSGEALGAACTAVGLPVPELGAELRLGSSAQDVAQRFDLVAPQIHESSQSVALLRDGLRGVSSPMEGVPALCASLYLTDKLSLCSDGRGGALPEAEDLLRTALLNLKVETGMAFDGEESGRLGNIDTFAFPAAGEFDTPKVAFHIVSKEENPLTLRVDIRPEGLPAGTEFLVHCRAYSGEVISLATCRQLMAAHPEIQTTFPVPPSVGRLLVSVWTRGGPKEDWQFWFEDTHFLIKSIEMSMGLMGLQGTVRAGWLSELMKNRRAAPRAKEMERISQVSFERTSVMSADEDHAWVEAGRTMREVAQRLFPQKSGGGFFPKGWDPDTQESGQLGFYEWFRARVAEVGSGTLLLIDPFFDTRGVELFARANETQLEYEVLTNSQVASLDDDPALPPTAVEPLRSMRLRKQCEEISVLLERMKFRVVDLRSKGGGKSQLFHDRYLLTFDTKGKLQRGFHLSNSIQGATRHSPLLVTPIPADVLPQLERYVADLREAREPAVNKAERIELYSSRRAPAVASVPSAPPVPGAPGFFAKLLGQPGLAALDEKALYEALKAQKQLRGASPTDGFEVTAEVLVGLPGYVDLLLDPQLDEVGFAEAWSALAEWLARSLPTEKVLEVLRGRGGERLMERLQTYLLAAPARPRPIGTQGITFTRELPVVPGLMKRDFSQLLREAGYLDGHLQLYGLGAYGPQRAAGLLVESTQPRVSQVIHALYDGLSPELKENDLHPQAQATYVVIGLLLSEVIYPLAFGDRGLAARLLGSPVPVLRALGAESLESAIRRKELGIPQAVQALQVLSEQERRRVLAGWVYELRIAGNRQQYQEPPDVQATRLTLFAELQREWPATMEPAELRALVHDLSGPTEGAWAEATSTDLLQPLCQQGRLKSDQLLHLWTAILFDRLQPEAQEPALFDAQVDVGLTQLIVSACIRASPEERHKWRVRCEALADQVTRQLRQPLLRSRDYSHWSQGIQTVLRLRALVGHAFLEAYEATLPADEVEALHAIHARLYGAAKSRLIRSHLHVDPYEHLCSFADEMDAAVMAHTLAGQRRGP